MTPLEGILVVDKPQGPTSHDVVEEVRRATGGLRVGHAGTLDPMATGVLPLLIGRATRLSRFLMASRKVYEGTLRLGVATDTYDIEGRIVGESPVPDEVREAVPGAVGRLTGPLMQTPPPYSARKVGGQRLHRLARRGVPVTPEPSAVTVFRFDILELDGVMVRFEVETSPGTYVRSLAHDLGADLGCGACLSRLRRLASGSLRVDAAHGIEEIRSRADDGTLGEIVIPLSRIDLGLATVTVTPAGLAAMRFGRRLTGRDLTGAGMPEGGPVRVEDEAGNLLGVALPALDPQDGEILRPHVVLIAEPELPFTSREDGC